MGEKSVRKKQLILEKARAVFANKGYAAVTMKDIVEACEISRGGLYLYYNSVDEIFSDIINAPKDHEDGGEDVFAKAVQENASSSDLLALFLQEQKKELLNRQDSLTVALYEYYFSHKYPNGGNPMKRQFDAAVLVIERLIEDGVGTGEFTCQDPKGAARNMMYALEGLRILTQTTGISEKAVNREILYLMKGLLKEE